MEITQTTVADVTVIGISGDLDGRTAPEALERIAPLSAAGGRLIIDLADVAYMSSAGLRLLLLLYRQASAAGGRLALLGLSDDLRDTMSATGFLSYFSVVDTLDQGLAELGAAAQGEVQR